ncbi:glutamate racemase [Streptomyces boncukensis]|uniref:Glutamate racemase n=1 Tax=Streptomyces boncukensis TaxID=2711219 RepID=A0A6G4WXV1_9ACTN|nr:aspartate/glutamate racemase family protein [Streptomyces boncukensis]NGO69460.1 glutamate racemase [Streptomyces boncukensis]
MKIALMDSGIGLLAPAAAVRRARPDADLVLSSDPDGMPYGPREPEDIAARALACSRAAAGYGPDALVIACNTASVHGLTLVRGALEPALPVIGTVPALKPAAASAAASGGTVAVWATPATTGSPYQRGLIAEFGNGAEVAEVPCHGLAEAVESGDEELIGRAVDAAAALTPRGVSDVVLGCTHFELVGTRIRNAVTCAGGTPPALYGSAGAIAAQVLRRIGAEPAPDAEPTGGLTVLHSGRTAELPPAALRYAEGRLLASAGVAAGSSC